MTRLWTGRSGRDLTPTGARNYYLLQNRQERLWGLPNFLVNGYRGSLQAVKRPGRGFDHWPSSIADVNNEQNYISSSHYMPLWHGKGQICLVLCFIIYLCLKTHKKCLPPKSMTRNKGDNQFVYKKDKAVPLQAWSGPEGSRKLRFPDFLTTAQDGGKVVNLKHRSHLPTGNTPGTHFY
jgi:hypothetical protein